MQCSQTYKVNTKTGVLTFNGASEFQIDDRGGPASFLTLAPNNAHAYYIAPEYMSCGERSAAFTATVTGRSTAHPLT